MHAPLFNSNWISDKKYKQTKHKSKATTSFQQLASYSSILCINALNCSNWFFFLHFNWVSTRSTTNNHCNGLHVELNHPNYCSHTQTGSPLSLRSSWVGDLTLSHTEAIGEPSSLSHASMHPVATHAYYCILSPQSLASWNLSNCMSSPLHLNASFLLTSLVCDAFACK